jgi:sorting nexin-7/30/sorting nexin-8
MEEKDQEEKQKYLRQNILDKGYDANDFIAFLESKKGEGASDISNWSKIDLYAVVQEYILVHTKDNTNSKPKTEPSNNNNTNTNTSNNNNINNNIEPKKENNNNNDKNSKILNDYEIIEDKSVIKNEMINDKKEKINSKNFVANDENFGMIVPDFIICQKAETNALNNQDNLEITVSDPQKVDNGFFSKAYINFLISTNPLNFKVRRKHADFVWLRERLSVIFNLNVLPRLPRKGKVNGDNHIKKRMRNLERFLNYLLKDNLVKNSKIFYDFLTLEKDDDFEKQKKIYNKLKSPTEIREVKTLDGKLKIQVTEQSEKYFNKIKSNAALNETVLKQINDTFKLLKLEMNATITRISSFFPMFDKLIKIRKSYLPNNILSQSYMQLKNIFTSWVDILKKQNNFFLKDVKEYLKLLGGNYHHMKELTELVDEQKNYYRKISRNLIAKKIDLYDNRDAADWQLDAQDKKNVKNLVKDKLTAYKKICHNSTVDAIKLKEKYGYQLNKIISEHERLRSIANVENRQKLIDFTRIQSKISSDHIILMGKIIGIMDDCFESPDNYEDKDKEVDMNEIQEEENNENNENNDIDDD